MSVLLSPLYLLFTCAGILNPLGLGKQIFRKFLLYNFFCYFKMHDRLYQGYNIIVLIYSLMGKKFVIFIEAYNNIIWTGL